LIPLTAIEAGLTVTAAIRIISPMISVMTIDTTTTATTLTGR